MNKYKVIIIWSESGQPVIAREPKTVRRALTTEAKETVPDLQA